MTNSGREPELINTVILKVEDSGECVFISAWLMNIWLLFMLVEEPELTFIKISLYEEHNVLAPHPNQAGTFLRGNLLLLVAPGVMQLQTN